MTSGPTDPIYDPFIKETFTQPSHEKAQAYGYSLANSVIDAFHAGEFYPSPEPKLNVSALEVELGIENFMLSLGTLLGIIDSDPKLNFRPPFIRYLSEVAFIKLGDATITGIPGELYPEIAVGGIENPQGADYTMAAQEIPHLRSQLPGKLLSLIHI